MKKSYHWFIVIVALLASSFGEAEDATIDAAELVRVYIEGQGHLPRNREISKKLDQIADEIAPTLWAELKRREDGDSLVAVARLATRVPDRSEARALVSAVRGKIGKIEGYSSDPLVAQNLRELERLVEDAAPVEPEANKSNSSGANERERVGHNEASKRDQESSESPERSPMWAYIVVAVAIIGIIFVLLRAAKRKGDQP